MTKPINKRPQKPKYQWPWIKPSDQLSVLVLAMALLLMSVSYWFYRGGHRGELIEIDRAEQRYAEYLVDINRADWPEIIQLPGLGEKLAQRILSDRAENGPFLQIEDLERVSGIGPKTLEKIRPYLLPIPDDKAWAGVEEHRTSTPN